MSKTSNSSQHAFLIFAHRDDAVFRALIRALDHPRNDIFIHMDSKNKSYHQETTERLVRRSKIYHCPRTKVSWGGYSMIKAELLLLKEATKNGHYEFYHLISGQDLPIKPMSSIHQFFDQHQGKEFVQFQSPDFTFEDRIRYYHPLQEIIGKNGPLALKILDKTLLKTQKLLHIKRNQGIAFQKGANWFSITDGLARHVVSQEPWLKQHFKSTKCCDEVFLQTIIINSDYKEHLYRSEFDDSPLSIMRLTDFQRGNPYIYRYSDLQEIKASDCLFARKFDPAVDEQIIHAITKSTSNK